MSEYQKQCPIDGGTCGQGGTCYVCENEALGSELTAAKTRIAELEKALEPFAREAKGWGDRPNGDDHPLIQWHKAAGSGLPAARAKFTIGDLRRAAALLKDK